MIFWLSSGVNPISAREIRLWQLWNYSTKKEDIIVARDVLFSRTPEGSIRRFKHRKPEDMLESIYEIMQNIPVEESMVLMAPDLNNLPCNVDLKKCWWPIHCL